MPKAIADDAPLRKETRKVDLRRLQLLERNARYMRAEQYAQLVENIRHDGTMTTSPLARWVGRGEPDLEKLEQWAIPSGNHRVRAAIDAGVVEDEVIFLLDPISDRRAMGIQLSHNAIAGEDDPAILRELYDEIDSPDWRAYSGLDDRTLELMEQVQVGALSEANLDFQTLTILFLPAELERAKAALADALEGTTGADERWLARFEDWDSTMDALDVAGKAMDVRNVATALALILGVFEAHVSDLAATWEAEEQRSAWVPAPSVTGWDLPPDAARVIGRAIDRMIARGDATAPWQALEFLAAEYLGGP